MAQKQFDATLPPKTANVTKTNGGAIGTSAVRVTIDDANCGAGPLGRSHAIMCLQAMIQTIETGDWPP